MSVVRALNSDARLIETDFGDAPVEAVVNTGLFDFEKAQRHPLWFKELNGFKDHIPETEAYGVRSFVYRARRMSISSQFSKKPTAEEVLSHAAMTEGTSRRHTARLISGRLISSRTSWLDPRIT